VLEAPARGTATKPATLAMAKAENRLELRPLGLAGRPR